MSAQGEITISQAQQWFDSLRSFREGCLVDELLSIADELIKKKKQLPKSSPSGFDDQPQE